MNNLTQPHYLAHLKRSCQQNYQVVYEIRCPNVSFRCRWQTHVMQKLSACYVFRITSHGNQTISFTWPSCWIQISWWVWSTVVH